MKINPVFVFVDYSPIASTSGQALLRDSGHGRGFFRPWVCNGSDNALNLLAEAAEIRSGESVLRPNVGKFALSGGCADNSQTHQPINPKLMDIGTDPNFHSDDVHMAGQDDLHHTFSSLEGFDLESAIAGFEDDMLGIDDIMFNFDTFNAPHPDFLGSEDFPQY